MATIVREHPQSPREGEFGLTGATGTQPAATPTILIVAFACLHPKPACSWYSAAFFCSCHIHLCRCEQTTACASLLAAAVVVNLAARGSEKNRIFMRRSQMSHQSCLLAPVLVENPQRYPSGLWAGGAQDWSRRSARCDASKRRQHST